MSETKEILLLGPSGSGKSTVCNALANGSVQKEYLTQPAVTESQASGITTEVRNNYVSVDDALIVTDTVGIDDNRFD